MNTAGSGAILLFNKPYGWSSFDVIRKIRPFLNSRKAGHAGTLDPLATGLLVVCTEKFTKKINMIQALEKEYTGTFFLGAETPSFDMETPVSQTFGISHITEEMIRKAAGRLCGKIKQIPPLHSAKKINGERAYKKARRGETLVLEPKEVTISEFEITGVNLPSVDFRVICSSGTYIRSLAHDLGKLLDNGAYLTSLCRTRIGNYLLKNAMEVENFAKSDKKEA